MKLFHKNHTRANVESQSINVELGVEDPTLQFLAPSWGRTNNATIVSDIHSANVSVSLNIS